ncbi:piggyBac transposable element-derived protein 4-like [Vespula squamosa]|uniref:PiggyBac transposable element-derived protein 4-like n=1 Tax=Vespula squamosa TaxID=30214 RepID=A0ABD2BHE0_VESSQ
MLKKCYDGEFFHEHITGDKIIGKTSNILGTICNNRREFPKLAKSAKDKLKLFYKSNNCTLTIHKSKPINKITIIINTKHKSVQINNDRKRLPETVITKLNSASMSSVKWQESTAPNQNYIDGSCKNAWIPYKKTSAQNIFRQPTIYSTNSRRAFSNKKRKTYKEH